MSRRNLNGYVSTNWGGGNWFDKLPPQSIEFNFPLYLNCTIEGYMAENGNYCTLHTSHEDVSTVNIIKSLREWIDNNLVKYEIPAQIINDNPIYINGIKVDSITYEGSYGLYFAQQYYSPIEGFEHCSTTQVHLYESNNTLQIIFRTI